MKIVLYVNIEQTFGHYVTFLLFQSNTFFLSVVCFKSHINAIENDANRFNLLFHVDIHFLLIEID